MSVWSRIEWTHFTFNPWWGCSRISPGCVHCYADREAARRGWRVWRRHGPRRMLSDEHWRRPLSWNRAARRAGERYRVFTASMADVFEDRADLDPARARLWELIEATPALDWQILTKRPANVAGMVPWGRVWPANVWLGVSVEDQRRAAERIPILSSLPARTRFASVEPLLGPVGVELVDAVDWLILGGESGPKARRTDPEWMRALIERAAQVGRPLFVKQAGAVLAREWACTDQAGHLPAQWPEWMRVRQFPTSPIPDVERSVAP